VKVKAGVTVGPERHQSRRCRLVKMLQQHWEMEQKYDVRSHWRNCSYCVWDY